LWEGSSTYPAYESKRLATVLASSLVAIEYFFVGAAQFVEVPGLFLMQPEVAMFTRAAAISSIKIARRTWNHFFCFCWKSGECALF
jgi:hypothetical protein